MAFVFYAGQTKYLRSMKWMLDLQFEKPPVRIHHREPILLMGSCFTENIGNALAKLYFNTLANPTAILFDPDSICRHLERTLSGDEVQAEELIYANERYQSLDFHSDFSAMSKEEALTKMNAALNAIRNFLPGARHLIITLGSAFVYRHLESNKYVANCHQFPADAFKKELLSTEKIVSRLSGIVLLLHEAFPDLQLIFTVSPVRHVRDGVVANNRSKGRLLEAVHQVTENYNQTCYFPSYEWVIDVLRDYRWYDLDLVHPNYAATDSVFEQFCTHCLDEWTREQLKELQQLRNAMEHCPRFPDTEAHRKFLKNKELLKNEIKNRMPWINF